MNLNNRTNPSTAARRPLLAGPLLCCAVALGLVPTQDARATPGAGVTPRAVAIGVLPEPVRAKFKADNHDGFGSGTDVADIVMVEFTIAPGGYFGWHKHGGPVWVVVKQGSLMLYDSEDVTCTGTAYAAGTAFLDSGDHVHNARNEGSEPAVVYGTFMLPDDGALRIDAPNPGVCPF